MVLGEASLSLENLAPELVEVALLQLLLGGGVDLGLLVDGVVLATLGGVEEDLGSLLDALKELVVLGAALGSLLIGVVLQDLLAVGLLDLLLGGLVAVLGQAKNLVVVLSLREESGQFMWERRTVVVVVIDGGDIPSSPWPHVAAAWGPRAR